LYPSPYAVGSVKRFSGSRSEIRGTAGAPEHQIGTEKLRRLGMEFGGRPRLEETIRQMLESF